MFSCLLWEVFCGVKRFTTGSRNSLRHFRKSQMMPVQVRKWLRQQSKDFYAAGFDALVKRWDKCTNVGEDMSRNKCFFFSVSNITCFISICGLFTDYLVSSFVMYCISDVDTVAHRAGYYGRNVNDSLLGGCLTF
jgi:hypothetical protein